MLELEQWERTQTWRDIIVLRVLRDRWNHQDIFAIDEKNQDTPLHFS